MSEIFRESRKQGLVDTLAAGSWALTVGALFDFGAGLKGNQLFMSRAIMTPINLATGKWFGMWRDYCYKKTKTTDEKSVIRKNAVNSFATISFYAPIYAATIGATTYFTEGQINWQKVKRSSEICVLAAPLIGYGFAWYQDGLRKVFGLRSAAEKAE